MSPRKAAAVVDHPCSCDATGFPIPSGGVSDSPCRCHCRVPVANGLCAMCSHGIHGVLKLKLATGKLTVAGYKDA